jgi:carbonic anhydrase/acetyltransferase-like protein (isoleucine patch superfamily)
MAIYQLAERVPQIHDSAFVHENATVIGTVILEEKTSVWPYATLRGDNEPIVIGAGSNVQDGAVLHTDMGSPLTIGKGVTIGHQAMLHSCTVGDGALIGIQAVILNKAKIGKNCLVGAGALVTEGKEFADGWLIMGSPAKAVRELSAEQIANMHANTAHYVECAQSFKTDMKRIG